MNKWPFLGGLIALLAAIGRFIYRCVDVSGTMTEKLIVDFTFLVVFSHILHHAGFPVPDLLPILPSIGGLSGN